MIRAEPVSPSCVGRARLRLQRRLAACLLLLAALVHAPARAEVRALLWASDYGAADADLRLDNTLRDARAIAALLRRVDIQDVRAIENPTAEQWNAELQSLAGRLRADDVVLLYYAGHAVQVDGVNYLLAADGRTLVSADDVLATVMSRARGTVFLVDACRNNPFRDQAASANRSLRVAPASAANRALATVALDELARAGNGLRQMGNLRGKNTIVLFSTDPGNVALDGAPGQGSPFANAAVRELGRRQSLDTAIRRITESVDQETGGRQSPWRQGDLTFPLFLAGQPRFPVP